MLFQTRSNNDHYMSGLADDVCEEAHSEMDSFNYRIRRTIEANDLSDLFEMPEEKKQNDSYFVSIFLKDKSRLLSFVKEYIENFCKDNLGKGYLIYKKQLEFIGQELIEKYNFYQDFYNTNIFNPTLKLEMTESLSEEIAIGLRPVEFIMFLILYKQEYIKLVEIDMSTSDQIFDINLILEFLKPADELFRGLKMEFGEKIADTSIAITEEKVINNEKGAITLTEKQKEILILLKQGYIQKEVAKEIKKSVNTVKSRLEGIYKKLGVTSTTTALAKAIELNLL